MIELSITAKSAGVAPPATPASSASPGGFALTLEALSDAPPARPGTVDSRQGHATDGKKLPPQTAEQPLDPGQATDHPGASAVPVAVPAPPPQGAPNIALAQAGDVTPAASEARAETAPAKAPRDDDATPEPIPATSTAILSALTPPILIDPSRLPGSAGTRAAAPASGLPDVIARGTPLLAPTNAPPVVALPPADIARTTPQHNATARLVDIPSPNPDTAMITTNDTADRPAAGAPRSTVAAKAPRFAAAPAATPIPAPVRPTHRTSVAAKDVDEKDAGDNDATPAPTSAAPPLPVFAPPILLDPSPLPPPGGAGAVAPGRSDTVANGAAPTVTSADAARTVPQGDRAASPIIAAPVARPTSADMAGTASPADPTVPPVPIAPVPASTATDTTRPMPPVGTTMLPANVQLLDPGAAAMADGGAAGGSEAVAPRIAVSARTPRFAVAPAATPVAAAATMAAQPARQAFAAALSLLSTRAPARDDDGTDPLRPFAGLTAPIGGTELPAAVQQVADGKQAALDLGNDRGLHGMIDRIEMLRDDANARDTRIRLVPDALGAVDVAIRRDGDAVHVRFSSANEATRLVLGDAQPRLTQLAEARGVRIAGSSVDAGTSGGNGSGQPQPWTTSQPSRPVPASQIDAAGDGADPTDQRLA